MELTLTREDFNKFFLHNYYYGHKKVYKYMRRYLGPIIAIIGGYLYFAAEGIIPPLVVGFCLAFGFFYAVLPFIILLARQPSDEKIKYRFTDAGIHVKDRLNEAGFDFSITPLHENKRYFFLRLENGQVIFFPKEKLDVDQRDQFASRVSLQH